METTPVGVGAAAPHRSRNGNDGAAVRFPHRHQFPARFRNNRGAKIVHGAQPKVSIRTFCCAAESGPAPNHVLQSHAGVLPAPYRSIPARGLPGCDTGAQWRTVAAPSRWRQAVGGDRKRRSGSSFWPGRSPPARGDAATAATPGRARRRSGSRRRQARAQAADPRPRTGHARIGPCPATRPYLACAGLTGSRPILRPIVKRHLRCICSSASRAPASPE